MIRLRGIDKSFSEGGRRREVLIQTDLSVAEGEFVCICGRSGSGKSTILNIISGIELPDAGEVIVDGQSLARLNDLQRTLFRRKSVGFVFQFFNLIPTLTAIENLLLPLQLNKLQINHQAQTWLQRLGLEDRGGAYPDTLSGGELQRLAIARALIHEPKIVLADEPTGNLDSDTGQQILEILDAQCRAQGVTLVTVSHSAEVAARADRVLQLGRGQLLEPETSEPSL